MAVIKTPENSSIKMTFSHGMDGQGNEIIKSKTLANVKTSATDDNIHAVAKGVSGLQNHTLMKVVRQDNALLSE